MKLPKDIEPLFGLWVLFELRKCSQGFQKEVLTDIKNGIYPKNKNNMTLEKFKQQLENNKVVTEESLLEMKSKTYNNGDEIKVGDKILFGMVVGENEKGYINLTMIMLNENQIDLYELDEERPSSGFMPTIKLK